ALVHARNRDTEYPYRQVSDFQYLTGFPEPEAVMALIPGREHGEYVLFCREKDVERELWDGYRAGQTGAVAVYGAYDVFLLADIDDTPTGLHEGRERVSYALGANHEFDMQLTDWIQTIRSKTRQRAATSKEFVACDHLLHDVRLCNSGAELRVL